MYRYRSLAYDAASGSVTPVQLFGASVGSCTTLQIRGQSPVIVDAGICLRAGVRRGELVCAWRDTVIQDAVGRGPLMVWTQALGVHQVGWTFGSWCAFGVDGLLYVQREPSGLVEVIEPDGTVVRSVYAPQSSTGIWRVDAGVPVMAFADPWYWTVNGVQVYHPVLRGLLIGGAVDQEEGMPPRAYLDDGTIKRMWTRPTDHLVELEVDAATVYLAQSGPDTPDPDDFSGYVDYAPYVAPVVPLPSIVIPPQRPAWIVDTEGILTPRGNGISTSDGPGPARFEDEEWTTEAMEPFIEAFYFGPEPSRFGRTKVVQAEFVVARVKLIRARHRADVPIFVCDEFGEQDTAEWIELFQQSSCRALWGVELYRPLGESREDFRARTRARLEKATA